MLDQCILCVSADGLKWISGELGGSQDQRDSQLFCLSVRRA